MFEVGQTVWDVLAGECTVTDINSDIDCKYPVLVKFADGTGGTYTRDGRWYEEQTNPSLYPYQVEIVKKVTKPSINWEHVNPEFRYLTQDDEGGYWLFEEEPIEYDGAWICSSGTCTSAEGFSSFIPGTCDWEDSLIARPVS